MEKLGPFALFQFPIFYGEPFKMKVILYLKCYKVLAELCLFISGWLFFELTSTVTIRKLTIQNPDFLGRFLNGQTI